MSLNQEFQRANNFFGYPRKEFEEPTGLMMVQSMARSEHKSRLLLKNSVSSDEPKIAGP